MLAPKDFLSREAQHDETTLRCDPKDLTHRLGNANVVMLVGRAKLLIRQILVANGLHERPVPTHGTVLNSHPAELHGLD